MGKDEEYGRWIKAEWDYTASRKYVASLRIAARTRMGVLADVVTVFNNMKIGVTELNVRDMPDGRTLFFISAEVTGREQLDLLMSRLAKSADVYDVTRMIAGREGE